MSGLQLPPKPPVAMPRLHDAQSSHTFVPKKRDIQYALKEMRVAREQENKLSTETHSGQIQAGQKRKISDDEDSHANQSLNKKVKLTSQPPGLVQSQDKSVPNSSRPCQFGTAKIPRPILHTTTDNRLLHTDFVLTEPAILRWDKATKTFLAKESDNVSSHVTDTIHSLNTGSHDPVTTSQMPISRTKRGLKTIQRNQIQEYNLRKQFPDHIASKALKRSAPDNLPDGESDHINKRPRITSNTSEQEATDTPMHEIAAKHKKKNKHRSSSGKKAQNQTPLSMRPEDLIPHYRPRIRVKAKEAAKPKPPLKTFMDLPMEIRLNIWDKVFEDEAYRFTLKKYKANDDEKNLIAHQPPSSNCLLIHPTLTNEVREQMYKSMRLELDFGRLRPFAVMKFTEKIGNHALGRKCERIFFIKKFGLHKVNMGNFIKAKEIVSSMWTVEGDIKMDEDDYLNNRVDPQHVLYAPPTQVGILKGLKERRLWKDQLAASEQYKRHLQGWCHPDSADPTQTVEVPDPLDPSVTVTTTVEVVKKSCPFDNKCLNLKDTKFCVMVKYKFGCVKGRHSRRKEVLFDFYPEDEKLVQLGTPKSKFHKKENRRVVRGG